MRFACLTVDWMRLKCLLTCTRDRRVHSALSTVKWCVDPSLYLRTQPTYLIQHCSTIAVGRDFRIFYLCHFKTYESNTLWLFVRIWTLSFRSFWKPLVGYRLDSFRRLRKIAKGFILSVRLSVLPDGTTRLPMDGFSLNLIYYFFETLSRKFCFH
jgi:hypothetical protein